MVCRACLLRHFRERPDCERVWRGLPCMVTTLHVRPQDRNGLTDVFRECGG